MSWNKMIHDFGKVPPLSKQTAEFVYEGPLEVVGVKGSCGCTTSTKDKKKVTATLKVPACNKETCTKNVNLTVTLQDPVTKQIVKQILKIKSTISNEDNN